jgi:hypothetical protein
MTIWRMRFACWTPKARHTHTLRICNTYCFSTTTLVTRLILRFTRTNCLSCRNYIQQDETDLYPIQHANVSIRTTLCTASAIYEGSMKLNEERTETRAEYTIRRRPSVYHFLPSLMARETHTSEIYKPEWLTGFVTDTTVSRVPVFTTLLLASCCKTLASIQAF